MGHCQNPPSPCCSACKTALGKCGGRAYTVETRWPTKHTGSPRTIACTDFSVVYTSRHDPSKAVAAATPLPLLLPLPPDSSSTRRSIWFQHAAGARGRMSPGVHVQLVGGYRPRSHQLARLEWHRVYLAAVAWFLGTSLCSVPYSRLMTDTQAHPSRSSRAPWPKHLDAPAVLSRCQTSRHMRCHWSAPAAFVSERSCSHGHHLACMRAHTRSTAAAGDPPNSPLPHPACEVTKPSLQSPPQLQ